MKTHRYAIPDWGVCATESQVNSPPMCKRSKLTAAESCIVVRKELVRWATLKEHYLQLANHAYRVMSHQLLPNGATVCERLEMKGTIMRLSLPVPIPLQLFFSQWIGAGSMDWRSSHVRMAHLTAAFLVAVQTLLIWKVVRCTAGCPLLLWIDMIWPTFNSSTWTVPISGSSPLSFLIVLNQRCCTLVRRSAIFRLDGTNVTSTVSSYSITNTLGVLSGLLMSISNCCLGTH